MGKDEFSIEQEAIITIGRELEARKGQPPLTKTERALTLARIERWAETVAFAEQYKVAYRQYCRALYDIRHPIGELPPSPAHNTPEEDLAMMDATTRGTARPAGDGSDLLVVDPVLANSK